MFSPEDPSSKEWTFIAYEDDIDSICLVHPIYGESYCDHDSFLSVNHHSSLHDAPIRVPNPDETIDGEERDWRIQEISEQWRHIRQAHVRSPTGEVRTMTRDHFLALNPHLAVHIIPPDRAYCLDMEDEYRRTLNMITHFCDQIGNDIWYSVFRGLAYSSVLEPQDFPEFVSRFTKGVRISFRFDKINQGWFFESYDMATNEFVMYRRNEIGEVIETKSAPLQVIAYFY